VFAAAQTTAFSGTLPPYVSFAAGSLESITVEAVGKVTLGGGEPYSGPHGVAFYDGTNLSSINGISGLIDSDLGFFLTAGVRYQDNVGDFLVSVTLHPVTAAVK
jgi:hypothetical protein